MHKFYVLTFILNCLGYSSERICPLCGNDGLPLRTIYVSFKGHSDSEALEDICERLNCTIETLPSFINDSLDACGNTYAHYACRVASMPYLNVCKTFGANLGLKNCCGMTPLDFLENKLSKTLCFKYGLIRDIENYITTDSDA